MPIPRLVLRPSWGGGSALTFFVAVCAFTWLEESTAKYGWEARVIAILLSGLLMVNATLWMGRVCAPLATQVQNAVHVMQIITIILIVHVSIDFPILKWRLGHRKFQRNFVWREKK